MKITEAGTKEQLRALLKYLNHCHDASMRKVCFKKQRAVDKRNGSLIYPFEKIKDVVLCDVEVELLLNSYRGAKKDQIVVLEFEAVKKLAFCQDEQHDYSDVHEVGIRATGTEMDVTFFSTKKKLSSLQLSCKRLICKEQ